MKWIFNPPGTPHFGGVYEVMIREAKKALRRIVGNADINDEELITVIVNVESILNERPLLIVDSDIQGSNVLTPNHFLCAGHNVESNKSMELSRTGLLRRWKRIQEISVHWWNRWRLEIIPSWRRRNKWNSPGKEIHEGDVVWELETDEKPG